MLWWKYGIVDGMFRMQFQLSVHDTEMLGWKVYGWKSRFADTMLQFESLDLDDELFKAHSVRRFLFK